MQAKILLVEDEISLSRATGHILEKSGYVVEYAYDGEEALKTLNENHYDLVLLDVMMPKKNGIEVLNELRQTGNDTKVIMLTAKAEIDDKVQGLELGADDYITKPYSLKELQARIKNALKNSVLEYEYNDVVLNYMENTMKSKNNPDFVFDLSKIETEILKKTMQGTAVTVNAAANTLNISNTHVELYVNFINKKLTQISENTRLLIKEDAIVLEAI